MQKMFFQNILRNIMQFYAIFLRMDLYPDRLRQLESNLDSGQRALYHFDRVVTKSWFVESGRTQKRLENVNLSNYLPHTIICGLLDHDSLVGDSTKVK